MNIFTKINWIISVLATVMQVYLSRVRLSANFSLISSQKFKMKEWIYFWDNTWSLVWEWPHKNQNLHLLRSNRFQNWGLCQLFLRRLCMQIKYFIKKLQPGLQTSKCSFSYGRKKWKGQALYMTISHSTGKVLKRLQLISDQAWNCHFWVIYFHVAEVFL